MCRIDVPERIFHRIFVFIRIEQLERLPAASIGHENQIGHIDGDEPTAVFYLHHVGKFLALAGNWR
jgi:hypothetical protein